MQYRFCSLPGVLLLVLATPAFAQLDRCLDAHGGLAKWRGFAGVEYDLTWKSAKGVRTDHQLFDLQTRSGLITSDKYTLGSSGGEVWVKPGLEALGGTPPRFYMGTPFYFFGMPFVFADPARSRSRSAKRSFRGNNMMRSGSPSPRVRAIRRTIIMWPISIRRRRI